MTQESLESLLNLHNVQTTVYISLTVANFLFGLLHPEYMVIAVSGVAFFTVQLLHHLHSGESPKVL
jgi:hypothetical protein